MHTQGELKRYLLFDASCNLCTQTAHAIEQETSGFLAARSLRDPEMQSLLDEFRPNRTWEPTLIEIYGQRTRIYTGAGMRTRLLFELGPRKAFCVARLATQFKRPIKSASATSRRHLLGRTLAAAGGLALATVGLQPGNVLAQAIEMREGQSDSIPLSGAEAQRYIAMLLASSEYQHLLAKLATTYSGILHPAEHSGLVVSHTSFHTVTVSIHLVGGAGYSFFTQSYDATSGQLVDTLAGMFTFDSAQNIVGHIEHNERPFIDAEVTPEGKLISGTQYDIVTGKPSGSIHIQPEYLATAAVDIYATVRHDCMACLGNCISAQGVPGWVVAFIAAVCGGACALSAGAGCLICMEGLEAVAIWVLIYCTEQCQSGVPWGGYVC